jgi:hypothetical protein
MIKNLRLAFIVAFLLTLALPVTAFAKGLPDGKVVFGGSYTLESGKTLNGDLVIFGGVATLEPGSSVNGNVALLGGNLEAGGSISGDIVGFGGLVELSDTAVVKGDVLTVGALLERAEGARIQGEVNNAINGPLSMTFPGGVKMPRFEVSFSPILDIIWFLFRVFIWSAIAVLVVMFLPQQAERIGETIIKQPVVAGGLGLLTIVILPFILVAMVITILLIPLAMLVVLASGLIWVLGILAVGLEVGKRTALMLKRDWPLAVSAGLGTFVLVLVMNGVRQVIPCIGWILPAVVILVGIGGVLLTRFGTQDYPLTPALTPVSGSDVEQPKSVEVAKLEEEQKNEGVDTKKTKKK